VGDSIRPLSRLTRLDEQEIRRILTSHGPRIFRAYLRHSEAEGLANQIRALGLRAATLRPEDIWEFAYVNAKQLNIGQGGISGFSEPGEPPLFIPFSDVAAIVQGEVAELMGKEKVLAPAPGEARMRYNYQKTVYVDIHRKSVPVAMRIRKPDFHMNPVVAGEPIEGPTDLDRFVSLLRERTTLAAFDDGFNRSADAVNVSLRMLDAGERVVVPPRSPDDEAPPVPPPLPPAPEHGESDLEELPAFELYSTLWRFQAVVE
jgi:hypothetical protein